MMATPTPSKALPQELTPGTVAAHLAGFSPPTGNPRSTVQSPAYYKRSPASGALLQHGSSGTNPTSGALMFESPSAVAFGLKLDLPPPDTIINAQYSLPDDEELRRRMDLILAKLKESSGRISPDGVETLAKRAGLDHFKTDEIVTIAGTSLLIAISFSGNMVTNLNLSFPGSPELVTASVEEAAKILKEDLTAPPNTPIFNGTLAKFEANLERLAKLDRASIPSSLNCFEAIVGIHTSLRRLYEVEKKKEKSTKIRSISNSEQQERAEEDVNREVLCKKSGCPLLHSNGAVGLRIDYWVDDSMHSEACDTSRPWSLIVECESCATALYPSVRVSDKWLPEDPSKIEVDPDDVFRATGAGVSIQSLNWQDPPIISIPTTSNDASNVVEALVGGAGPNVRFVAKLDPPIVVPLQVAYNIYGYVGIVVPQEASPPIYDHLLLPRKSEEKDPVEGTPRIVNYRHSVLTFSDDQIREKIQQDVRVYIHRPDYGTTLTEIPFSHPQQLIGLLPTLRQHATFSTILRQSTRESSNSTKLPPANFSKNPPNEVPDIEMLVQDDQEKDLTEFLDDAQEASQNVGPDTTIDISFIMQPIPRITCAFHSSGDAENSISFTVEIDQNGEFKPVVDNTKSERVELKGSTVSAKAARAFSVCKDIGVIVESIKKRV